VVCNLPAAQVEAIENWVAVSRHVGVVGKPDRPSPDIQSKITEINFNPFWTVPSSIVRRDLIPRMQQEPDYLTKNRIRIFDQHGSELQPQQVNWYTEEAVNYQFKQDPGDFNSLGSIRINFPNPYSVYMHDTPFKNLFAPSASIFPTRTRSTCTTRRSRTCSARISASTPPVACACRTCASS
jgi:murein L,D-transpeptidase YcbB/YkuD